MNSKREGGAHVGIRTRDLFLTKEVLYRLSYVGAAGPPAASAAPTADSSQCPAEPTANPT